MLYRLQDNILTIKDLFDDTVTGLSLMGMMYTGAGSTGNKFVNGQRPGMSSLSPVCYMNIIGMEVL
jgi:hypothetical protein